MCHLCSPCATSSALTASLFLSMTQREPTITASGLKFTPPLTNSKTFYFKHAVRSIRVLFQLSRLSGSSHSTLFSPYCDSRVSTSRNSPLHCTSSSTATQTGRPPINCVILLAGSSWNSSLTIVDPAPCRHLLLSLDRIRLFVLLLMVALLPDFRLTRGYCFGSKFLLFSIL